MQGLKFLGILLARKVNPPLGTAEEEVGVGEFPAVVNPEPVGGGAMDFALQQ